MVELGVRAILKKDNKILLIKRVKSIGKNTWALPGGRVESKEKAIDAISREILEELNLNFNPKFITYDEDQTTTSDIDYLTLFFDGTWEGEIKAEINEISEVKFFSLEEIKDSNEIGLGHKEVLLRVLN